MKRLVSSLLPSLAAFSLLFLSIHNTLCFLCMKTPFGMETGGANQLELRSYQKECVAQAIAKNTVVCLKTGLGKTLIAVKAWSGALLSLLKCGDFPTQSPSLGFIQHVRRVTLDGWNGDIVAWQGKGSLTPSLSNHGSHGSYAKYSCNLHSAGHRSLPRQAAAEDPVLGSYEGSGETAGRLLQTKLPWHPWRQHCRSVWWLGLF